MELSCYFVGVWKGIGIVEDCFDQQGMEAVVGQRYTAYELTEKAQRNKEEIPCYELQRSLGDCVATRAKELEGKIKARKAKLKEQQQQEG